MTNTEIINLIQEQITTLQQMKRKLQLEDFTTSEHPELELILENGAFLTVIVQQNPERKDKLDPTCEICTKDFPHNPIGIMYMGGVGIREDFRDYVKTEVIRGHDIADKKDDVARTEHSTFKRVQVKDFTPQIQELIFEAVTEYIPMETA